MLVDTLIARDRLLPDLRHRHIDTPKTPDDDAATREPLGGHVGPLRRWCVSFGVPRLLLLCVGVASTLLTLVAAFNVLDAAGFVLVGAAGTTLWLRPRRASVWRAVCRSLGVLLLLTGAFGTQNVLLEANADRFCGTADVQVSLVLGVLLLAAAGSLFRGGRATPRQRSTRLAGWAERVDARRLNTRGDIDSPSGFVGHARRQTLTAFASCLRVGAGVRSWLSFRRTASATLALLSVLFAGRVVAGLLGDAPGC